MFTPDEMPGAMEEIAPSDPHRPYDGHSLGRLLTERAMRELDGRTVAYTVQDTNRGREVLVHAGQDRHASL